MRLQKLTLKFKAYISDGSIRAEYSGTITGVGYSSGDMVIKTIYTEREKTDVTESNCIMCGECIKYCPEDNALSLTCAGKKLYTASRKKVMSGYASKKNEVEI